MNPSPIFELIWFSLEGTSEVQASARVALTLLGYADQPRVIHSAADIIACPDLFCKCSRIQFRWQSAAGRAGPSFAIDLDTNTAVITPEMARDSAVLLRAGTLEAELKNRPAELDLLWQWFLGCKLIAIQKVQVFQVEKPDLPEVPDGKLIPFTTIFPHGVGLNFDWEGIGWTTFEHFCVARGCDCHEVLLAFVPTEKEAATAHGASPENLEVYYDYLSGQLVVRPDDPVPGALSQALLTALKQTQATLNFHLEMRHMKLRCLYLGREIARQRDEMKRLRALPPMGAITHSPKIGRNEPYPCGSGRKYKHCCLNQPARPPGAKSG